MQMQIAMRPPPGSQRKFPRLWAMAAGISALCTLVGVAIYVDMKVTLAAGEEAVAAKTEIVVAHVEHVLQSIDLAIRTLDENLGTPEEFELPRQDVLTLKLKLIQSGTDGLLGIFVVNAEGRAVANAAGPITSSADLRSRAYFSRHADEPLLGLLVSAPIVTQPSGQISVPVSRGVYSSAGFEGVIAGRLDPGYFEQFFRRVDADSVALILRDGTFLARTPRIDLINAPPHVAGRTPFAEWSPENAKPKYAVSPFEGIERIYMVRSLRGLPLGVAVSMDVEKVLARWKVRRNVLALAAVLISGLAVALMIVVGRRDRDKAARREAEALAAASRHMQSLALDASKRKSEFLAHMSHEIRTPLNAILGFSEVMKDQIFGPVMPAKYQSYAGDIHYSAEHLLSVVNNVLDLSKVEAGKWEQNLSEVPLVDLVGSARRLVAPNAEREGVRITVSRLPAVVVRGDERMLRQILLNLLANAIRFAGADRAVGVVCTQEADGALRLSVTDHGPGLSEQDIQRVLRPFETAASTQARQRQDTGLGLPLARMFAEMHEGDLTIESRPGAGTTVCLFLPASRIVPL
jgi:two-component system cell cycle sensor histidine kinase PleC